MSGETEHNISGWTVDTLHQHVLGMVRDLRVSLDEVDVRYQQRFEAQQLALKEALLAAEKAVTAALTAADRAVQKAESATEKRFESVNEFRAQLADQSATFMPRAEANARFSAMDEKFVDASKAREINNASLAGLMSKTEHEALQRHVDGRLSAMEKSLERNAGELRGKNQSWGYLVAAVGLISTLLTIVIVIYSAGR